MGATANTGRKVTELLLEAGEEVRALGSSPGKLADLDVLGVRRSGTPAEIADAVLYLLSDQAAFVTGTALVIDAGLSAA